MSLQATIEFNCLIQPEATRQLQYWSIAIKELIDKKLWNNRYTISHIFAAKTGYFWKKDKNVKRNGSLESSSFVFLSLMVHLISNKIRCNIPASLMPKRVCVESRGVESRGFSIHQTLKIS